MDALDLLKWKHLQSVCEEVKLWCWPFYAKETIREEASQLVCGFHQSCFSYFSSERLEPSLEVFADDEILSLINSDEFVKFVNLLLIFLIAALVKSFLEYPQGRHDVFIIFPFVVVQEVPVGWELTLFLLHLGVGTGYQQFLELEVEL